MQTLLIYVFVRLGEGETEHNKINVLLLSTVWVRTSLRQHTPILTTMQVVANAMSEQMVGLCLAQLWMGPSQKDWAFEEPRRRYGASIAFLYLVPTNHSEDLPYFQLYPHAVRP
jgi:hypothetical protein